MSKPNNKELIDKAKVLYDQEKLFEAARLLRQIDKDSPLLTDFHRKILRNASICGKAVSELLAPPNKGEAGGQSQWIKQGQSNGSYPTTIYYKVETGAKLTCRMETPVPTNLLVPLLSVLNESELYGTWIPSWTVPIRLGVKQSKQLINDTRGHQIIQVQCDVPWPMSTREVLMDVMAIDDIDKNGFIVAKMQTLTEASQKHLLSGFEVPTAEYGIERIDYDGAVLFRPCPVDHPNYASAKEKFSEELILLQFVIFFDAHMMVPQSVVNFITRTVVGHIWNMLLHVAEEVRDGQRKEHKEAIERKADFYKWVDERSQFMLQQMKGKKTGKDVEEKRTIDEDGGWTMEDILNLSI
ncbi:unnamed protein product [Cylindrotheca closterium]|uniref:START domain-containing protein n=1 Tax=Cylindrotheca closterium TaxID=2856 RepID=A0AAD2FTZ6_9STRA|nr:unnamed protein product [Cylindrotheca closterium]